MKISNENDLDNIKIRKNNLFDIVFKQNKKGKKFNFTNFYMINEDLF